MFPWEPKRCMTWSTHWTSSVRMVTMSLTLMCIWWPLQLLAPQTGWNENKYGYTLKEQLLLSYKLACKNQELNRLPLSAEERPSAEQQEACLHFSNFRTLLELRINDYINDLLSFIHSLTHHFTLMMSAGSSLVGWRSAVVFMGKPDEIVLPSRGPSWSVSERPHRLTHDKFSTVLCSNLWRKSRIDHLLNLQGQIKTTDI